MGPKLVTVFGGSGFVGRHIVQRLAHKGYVVRVAVRDPESALYLKPMGRVGQVTPVQASLRDPASVRAAIDGSDMVINLVGILYESGKQTFDAIHRVGAATVAKAAKEAGVKTLVHMSALGADKASKSKYARSKALGEEAVLEAFPEASIIRPSVIFGPHDDFFNKFAAMAKVSPALPLIGGGHTKFQPVYVGDVADAFLKCLEDKTCAGHTYDLAGPSVYTFEELMELVLHEIGAHRGLIPLPFPFASLLASVLELLPVPPLTRDQVKLLKKDNVLSGDTPGLEALGIEATAAEVILPTYMGMYRKGGQFNPLKPA